MAMAVPTTATEILGEAFQPVAPHLSPELSQLLLTMRLSDTAQECIRDLLQRNNAGTLDSVERTALDNYLLVGQFIDLLQAKARTSLQRGASTS